ncbi:MAG TPA: hypothetical protein VMV10_10505 [Pirellulales bacterium]|nr:hypothetical protein [Pirellulales bacterium]
MKLFVVAPLPSQHALVRGRAKPDFVVAPQPRHAGVERAPDPIHPFARLEQDGEAVEGPILESGLDLDEPLELPSLFSNAQEQHVEFPMEDGVFQMRLGKTA